MADSVAAALEGRSRLLVFDNCEHVLDAAADMIEAILAHSATVKILATSREGLRASDEQLWPVPSLDVAVQRRNVVRRARPRRGARNPLTGADAAVVEICRRLDGIPLAIELAASRMQSMTVTELRDRLDDRFRLLVGSRRGLERHQTLRHAVQWSYDLLDETKSRLLQRCSVFAGGFDLAGACAVAGSDDEIATLDLLDSLVRKSLLVADRSSGRTRFSMLETIRQFAEEQLVASPVRPMTSRTAHARYFAGRRNRCTSALGQPAPARSVRMVHRSSCRTCAPHSGGPPTTMTSTPPPPSPSTQRSSVFGSNSTSPSGGPRNSSNLRRPSNIDGWHSST